MNFFIKTENGIPVNHPVSEENLRIFFPDLDINNPPEGWDRFVRVPYPELSFGETIENTTYELSNSLTVEFGTKTYVDFHHIRPLTDEELILLSIDAVKYFNEEMRKTMNAPYPAPDNDDFYVWSNSSSQWVKRPDNFDEVLNKYYDKLKELGLENLTPQEIENLDQNIKDQLQLIVNELGT